MNAFGRPESREGTADGATTTLDLRGGAPLEDEDTLQGERSTATVDRARSVQSRVSSVLAVGLMIVLGGGLLIWYYTNALTRQAKAEQNVKSTGEKRAQGDSPLPPLGKIDPPRWTTAPAQASAQSSAAIEPLLQPAVAPPPPANPGQNSLSYDPGATYPLGYAAASSEGYGASSSRAKTPEQLALERRLSGSVFSTTRGSKSGSVAAVIDEQTMPTFGAVSEDALRSGGGAGNSALASLLRPSATPAAQAQVLPTQRFLLAKGAFIDCTLETAIDSTLAGMTTCITATDTFGADGKVVLLERGTKLVGETQGTVKQGAARIFVLWTEARTPTGVVVPLDSPGTDELGRSGLPGKVNRHFWERFGAAILISMIDGAVQGAAQSNDGDGPVIYSPSRSSDIMTEVLKSTINIPPTVVKKNGDRIQVLAARDLDFRPVYELRPVASGR